MKHLFITATLAVSLISSAFATDNLNKQSTNCCTADWNAFTIEASNNTNATNTLIKESATQTFYNNDGALIGSTKVISFDKLPEKAIRNIGKNYPAPVYNVKACIEFTNAVGETNYYVSFDSNDTKTVLEVSPFGNVSVFKTQYK